MTDNTLKRIKQYLDFKGIKISYFEKEVGMSNGSFASQLKNNKTIGVDKLENILKKYPDINIKWLLTGKESMFTTEKSILEENLNYKELAEARLEIIALKNEKIALLTEELKNLKKSNK